MKKDITELYCFIDDFCTIYVEYEKKKLIPSNKQGNSACSLSLSEMLTINLIIYQKNVLIA